MVKPIWILLKQESGSGISRAIYKSAPHSRQITTPAVKIVRVCVCGALKEINIKNCGLFTVLTATD